MHASCKSSTLASASKKSRATLARRSQSTESKARHVIDIDAPISDSAVRETLVGDSGGEGENEENPTDDRYDFDGPINCCPMKDCREQLNQKLSEKLQHLLDKRAVRVDRSEGDFELSVLGWEAEICKGNKHENILAHNLDIGWPATIDYSGLMARVFALRSVLEEVIEEGQNGFIYQRLLEHQQDNMCIGRIGQDDERLTRRPSHQDDPFLTNACLLLGKTPKTPKTFASMLQYIPQYGLWRIPVNCRCNFCGIESQIR